MSRTRMIVIGSIAAAIFAAFVATIVLKIRHDNRSNLSFFVERFGPPDEDESSETEIPRPKFPTRRLYYQPEKVRAFFVPESESDRRPYKYWKLLFLVDAKTTGRLSAEEACSRLGNRDRYPHLKTSGLQQDPKLIARLGRALQ